MTYWCVLKITLIFVKPKCRRLASIGAENCCVVGLHSTTRCGDAPTCAGPVGPPSQLIGACGSRGVLGALSLDRGR